MYSMRELLRGSTTASTQIRGFTGVRKKKRKKRKRKRNEKERWEVVEAINKEREKRR